MISFTQYLEEKNYPVPTAYKEWVLASDGYLPISPSILQKFEKDITVYHITDIKGMQNVIKHQHGRKDLATFTRSSGSLSKGIYTKGEVLFTLEGKTSFASEVDASTFLDRNGIRWLSNFWDADIRNDLFTNKMLKAIESKYDVPLNKNPKFLAPIWHRISRMVSDMSGKEKSEFVKFYIDETKKLLTDSTMKAIMDEIEKLNVEQGLDANHNEILLHNYKVIDIKIIKSSDPSKYETLKKNAERAGINISKYKTIDQHDLAKLSINN
jgi:hypothetical protein